MKRRARSQFLKLVVNESSRRFRQQNRIVARTVGGGSRNGLRLRRSLLVQQFEHLLNGLNAGDRFSRVREGEGDGAKQLAVDVDGASAHPGDRSEEHTSELQSNS